MQAGVDADVSHLTKKLLETWLIKWNQTNFCLLLVKARPLIYQAFVAKIGDPSYRSQKIPFILL